MCDGPGTMKQRFSTLSQNKNIVLLSKRPCGKKCLATFLYSVVDCLINPDELHYVVRSGIKTGAGVEIDPESMYGMSQAKLVPTAKELIKVSTMTEVENLKAPRTGTRRRTNRFAMLTPVLAKIYQ